MVPFRILAALVAPGAAGGGGRLPGSSLALSVVPYRRALSTEGGVGIENGFGVARLELVVFGVPCDVKRSSAGEMLLYAKDRPVAALVPIGELSGQAVFGLSGDDLSEFDATVAVIESTPLPEHAY